MIEHHIKPHRTEPIHPRIRNNTHVHTTMSNNEPPFEQQTQPTYKDPSNQNRVASTRLSIGGNESQTRHLHPTHEPSWLPFIRTGNGGKGVVAAAFWLLAF